MNTVTTRSAAQPWLMGVIAAIIASCGMSCSENDGSKLVGAWEQVDAGGSPVKLTFDDDGGYILRFLDMHLSFTGAWNAGEGNIRLVDEYCGTKFPGLYRFRVDGNSMRLELIDDPVCDRKKFIAGPWKRAEASYKLSSSSMF